MNEVRQEVQSDEARRDFRRLLNTVEHDHAHMTIKRYGTPAAVMVPLDWYYRAREALAFTGEE